MSKTKEKKLNKSRKYCYSCGALLNAELNSTTYDNETGEARHTWDFSCPNNKKLKRFNRHEIWEPFLGNISID